MSDVNKLLVSYTGMVLSANRNLNLVSRTSVDKLLPELLSESLIPLGWNSCRMASPLLDVGSGGGFPGIPLAISRPDIPTVLLDSNRKKVLFLKSVIQRLPLPSVEAIWMRFEDFVNLAENQRRYGTVTARGVGDFDLLTDSAAKALAPDGELIVWLSALPEINPITIRYFDHPEVLSAKDGLLLLMLRRNEVPME